MATGYSSTATPRTFSIGNVLSESFRAITTNPVLLLGVAFVCSGLPQGALSLVQGGGQEKMRYYAQLIDTGAVSPAMLIVGAILLVLVVIPIAVIAQGVMICATMNTIEGKKATLGDCLATAIPRILPLLGLMILSGIAIGFAMLLLIVPGVILSLVWYVAAPALVIEGLGVSAALGRSADLTRGLRWQLFGLAIIVAIISGGVSMVVGGIGTAIMASAGRAADGSVASGIAIAAAAFSAIGSTVSAVVSGVVPTALYAELRQVREGPIADTLGEVFA